MNTSVICYDRNGQPLDDGLVQWDVNVTIQVGGADTTSAPNFHFCQKGRGYAYVVPSTVKGDKLEAAIPNVLLQSHYPIVVFLYYSDDSGEQRSKYQFQIGISPREIPMEYVYIENIGYEDWVKMTEDAKRIVEASEGLDGRIKQADEILSQMDSNVAAAQSAEKNAASHEANALEAAEEASASKDTAVQSAEQASNDAAAAAKSAQEAKDSENIAVESAGTAKEQAESATQSASEAADSLASTKEFAAAAEASADKAADSEKQSGDYASLSKSYAVGNTGTRNNEDTDNSKYYCESAAADALRAEEAAEQAQSIAQGALGYYPTEEKLLEAYPEASDGNWAIVGETDTIWVWDSDNIEWTDSGNKTDLSQYYTRSEMDEIVVGIDEKIEAATSRSWDVVVPAEGWIESAATWGDLEAKWETTIEVPDMTDIPNIIKIDFVDGSRQANGRWTWVACDVGSVTLYSTHNTPPESEFTTRITEVR